jgi:hypothetical protein
MSVNTPPYAPRWYDYLDAIGGPAQRIQVLQQDGELFARFPAIEGDEEPGEIPVADMAGDFQQVHT